MERWASLVGFAVSAVILFTVASTPSLSNLSAVIGIAGGLAAIFFFLAYLDPVLNQALRDFPRLGGRVLKSTFYLALYGVIITILIINFFKLKGQDAVGAFTVTAEGLGFIGLSLVELTIFLWARRPRRPMSLTSQSNMTRGEILTSMLPILS